MTSRLLSNIVVGRNDDYGGDYLRRLATSLDHLAWNLQREGRADAVEVVYVDWGSETPVADAIELGPGAAAMVRFVEVAPALVRELSEPDNFYSTLAVNVGVRRAEGEYVMLTDSDCLMRRIALSQLLRFLEGKLDASVDPAKWIFPLRRIQIPYDIVRRNPSLEAWDALLEALQPGARTESPGTGCLGGFSAGQLMHASLWHEFAGYNESLKRSWGWSDNELMLRVTRKYGWADLAAYGVMAFHMEHGPRRRWWNPEDLPQRDSARINAMTIGAAAAANGPGWGLGDEDLPIRRLDATRIKPPTSGRRFDPLRHDLLDRGSFAALMASPGVQQTVQRVAKHYTVELREEEQQCIAALAGYVGAASPLNLFYCGDLVQTVLFAILSEHTAIHAYLLRPWLEGDTGVQPCNPAGLSQVLEQSMYRGYARIMTGAPAASLETVAPAEGVELAVVNTSRRPTETGAFLDAVVGRLARGGLVVVFGPHRTHQVQRYDRVAGTGVRRRPYSVALDAEEDVLRVITLRPDFLNLIVRPPYVGPKKVLGASSTGIPSTSQPA